MYGKEYGDCEIEKPLSISHSNISVFCDLVVVVCIALSILYFLPVQRRENNNHDYNGNNQWDMRVTKKKTADFCAMTRPGSLQQSPIL